MDIPIERALATGLVHRPLAETIADTLAWARERQSSHSWKAGLSPEREKALLEAAG
jgi:2'-hydroxyisoflavone reductase